MTEPFFHATTPDGRWTVVVEVLPDERFKGMVLLDAEIVTEVLTTGDQPKLLAWVRKQMVAAMRRTEA